MILVGDKRSSHVMKWFSAFRRHQNQVLLLSDFSSDDALNSSTGIVETLLRVVSYLKLCCLIIYKVVFSKSDFHVHYVSRYSIASFFIPSNRLFSYVYGSDIQLAPKQNKFLKKAILWNLSRSKVIVVSSKNLMNSVSEYITHNSIEIVPFGIEKEFIVDASQVNQPDANGDLVFGCFKYCKIDVYRLDYLLSLFQELLRLSSGKAKLLLINAGPEVAKLKKIVSEMKLSDKVEFLNSVSSAKEIFEYLDKVDATIYPSRRESFGVSLLESMAAAKPSFVAKVGGMQEIIVDAQNGFFLNTTDAKVDAELIYKIMTNQKQYSSIAKNGLQTIATDFVWENHFENFCNQYCLGA